MRLQYVSLNLGFAQKIQSKTFKRMKSKQNIFDGWLGETATAIALNAALDRGVYTRIDNIVIPTRRGGTAQIDHTIISRHGIFVLETKNYAGQIYGDADSAEWFQDIHGTSRPFLNPLRQNYGHVRALAEFLDYPESVFEAVVLFVGESVFRSPMPKNVLSSGLVPYILSFGAHRLTRQEVDKAVARLRVYLGSAPRLLDHIRNVRARMDAAERCPCCGGGRLTQRTSGRGLKFWGCSQYPACRYTRSLEAPFPQEHFLIARRLEHPGNPEKQGAAGRRPGDAPLRLQLRQSVLARRNHYLVSETADQRSGKKHGYDSGGPAQTCDHPGMSKMQHASAGAIQWNHLSTGRLGRITI